MKPNNFWKLTKFDKKNINFIKELYLEEKYPIFEHNFYHIFGYLGFKKELYAINKKNWSSIIFYDKKEVYLFTPVIRNLKFFISDIKKEFKYINIINVSKDWLNKNHIKLESLVRRIDIQTRSKEEAIYDLNLLNELPGSHFAKLRNINKKLLLNEELVFKKIKSEKDLKKAKRLISKWNKVQGFKYIKNKESKEKFLLEKVNHYCKNDKNLRVEMGIVKNKVLSLVIYFISPTHSQWSEIYMIKGINRSEDQGVHGVSDASYLHVFKQLKLMGANYVNDGELGYEEGTRLHKLRFKPIKFLQSFDLKIEL